MAVKKKSGKKAATTKGLTAETFKGLDKKRLQSKSGDGVHRVRWSKGEAVPIQFLTAPTEFRDYSQHVFQEDGRWNYVPCVGSGCPLCSDEDDQKRKKSYQFTAIGYDLKERKPGVVKGPKTLATQIFYRYKRDVERGKPEMFVKRVYDVTQFPTTPVSYNFEIAEEAPVNPKKIKHNIDLQKAIDSDLKRYYGDDLKEAFADSELDDDDDDFEEEDDFEKDDDDEEEPDEDEMLEMKWADLKEYAYDTVGVKKKTNKRSELIRAIVKKRGY